MSDQDAGTVTVVKPGETQVTALALVVIGLLACAAASRFGWHDLNTMAIGANAAGLTLLTQRRSS
ncbi:MAG TPA: hypothetical protein VMD97_02070 [Candidatus Aquilonibacter sp.]|nr:hypothetical protein [Candidatus Aquilonibacter sp.]